MQSTINNSYNCDANASISNSDYEKNEYYAEFGLAKGQKKDAKARNHLAAKQAGERQKKVAEQVSLLPKKMQAKLATETVFRAPTTGNTKIAPVTKPFYDRQKKTQDQLLDDYAEQCVAEDDAFDQLCEVQRDEEMYEAYCEEIAREHEEADAHYNDYERAREEEDEAYQKGLEMWLKYGLTKEQYDANREYESNVKALNAFYRELDYQSHPDYENRLIAAIKKYEDDFDAEQKAQALKDEQNEWWVEPEMVDEFDDIQVYTYDVNPYEDFEPEEESFEDWCERKREEALEGAMENAMDDDRDDDDY